MTKEKKQTDKMIPAEPVETPESDEISVDVPNENLSLGEEEPIPSSTMASDEPPIGFSGGSAFFDIPEGITLVPEIDTQIYGVTYKKYRIASDKVYTAVSNVQVLTEKKRLATGIKAGDVTLVDLPQFNATQVAKVKIWLKKGADITPITGPPDILIEGKAGAIFTKKELIAIAPHPYKSIRKNRFFYEAVNNHTLEIYQWQIVADAADGMDTSGVGLYEDYNQDLFILYIRFYHH